MSAAGLFGTEGLMIGISACVLLSYWFSHLGRLLRLPSVVFLLVTGLALRVLTDAYGVTATPPPAMLPVLGTIGLILIVLEGGLDLNLKPGRRVFLLRTFAAAVIGVVATSALLAVGMRLWLGLSWTGAALMALPFAVISSAVAIPSAEALVPEDREFVIYESSWSDIVGAMLFNAVVLAVAKGGSGATLNFFAGAAAVLVLGIVIGLAVFWLVGHLEGHVKFVPLIFALVGVYAAAKALHLSPLLIVLILGLMLNNPHLVVRWRWLERLGSSHYVAELDRLKHLTAEATFFTRTFFFLLLGYSTDLASLVDLHTLGVAVAILVVIFALRVPVLALFAGGRVRPLVWAGPRGLITVLLFFSLPAASVPDAFPTGVLILVVLLSCLIMAAGLRRDHGRHAPPAADEPGRRLEAGAAPPP